MPGTQLVLPESGSWLAVIKEAIIRGSVHCPKKYGPDVCADFIIDFTDFLPTLLQISEAEHPLNKTMDGRSFVPQLLGKAGNPRDWIFCHYDPKWRRWKLKRYVQTKKWKLYGSRQIFNIQSDPDELHPVSLDQVSKKDAGEIQRLQKVLDQMK